MWIQNQVKACNIDYSWRVMMSRANRLSLFEYFAYVWMTLNVNILDHLLDKNMMTPCEEHFQDLTMDPYIQETFF